MEALQRRDEGVHRCSIVPGTRLYMFLRSLHRLERRLRLGRPLRLNRGADGRLRLCAAAAEISRALRKAYLDRRHFPDRSELDNPDRVLGFLVAAGNLSSRGF